MMCTSRRTALRPQPGRVACVGFTKGALAAGEQAESDRHPPPPPRPPSLTPGIIHRALGVGGGRRAAPGGGERCDRIRSLRRASEYSICQNVLPVDIFIRRAPGVDNKTANANLAGLMNHRRFPSVMRRTGGRGRGHSASCARLHYFSRRRARAGPAGSQRLPGVSQCFYPSCF